MEKHETKEMPLYTIGYEKRTLEDIVQNLKSRAVSTLVDVREVPFSRKKGFSKKHLSAYLKQFDIDYVHLKELGSPKSLRDKVRADGDYPQFFSEFYKYILTQHQALEFLYRLSLEKVCCVMCYERSSEFCHRKTVAEEVSKLDSGNITVNNIL